MARENESRDSRRETETKRDIQFWLDVAMKLTVPLSAVAAVVLANHFEQNRANLQLINQREQAESSLRATMFGQLIAPIAGGAFGCRHGSGPLCGAGAAADAQFPRHFELKPLLRDADDRLSKYQEPFHRRAVLQARGNLRRRPTGSSSAGCAAVGRRDRAMHHCREHGNHLPVRQRPGPRREVSAG
jgi:hypothetical protein